MYLSRIKINPARRGGRALIAGAHKMHGAVLASFPDPVVGVGGGPRILWRLDVAGPQALLYVVSPDPPDFTHIVDQAGWPAAGQTWETADYAAFLGCLAAGQTWRFRLMANPVHSVRTSPAQSNTKRTALFAVAAREEWLVRRAERSGFRIAPALAVDDGAGSGGGAGAGAGLNLRLTSTDVVGFQKRGGPARGQVTIARTQYDGVLEVADADALRRALVVGIGPAKGYGCGLLSLAPV